MSKPYMDYKRSINRRNEMIERKGRRDLPYAQYELCAGCDQYHEVKMLNGKVMVQMPHKPCTQTS
jgi:hypothetical protein